MIPQITEINFPEYATLHEATGSFADMGERTITTQVRIDGDVVPEFDGWELEFKGERFVLPVKEPQAQKNNTTRNSLVDLTFYSWPIYQMKRFFFFETTTTATGTVMADKYQASVNLNLVNFVNLFNRVLDYYFDGKIVADLATGSYGTEVAAVQLNYSYIWDVLQDFYSLFKVRWYIEYDSTNDVYYIKIGYSANVINDHDFEYGYEGGLLHFERQVQDDNIKNILLGRGGEKNLPYRYFKATDPNNPEWAADPDAIPELANIYFDRLRDLNFRSYVQGWRTNPNGMAGALDQYDATRGARDWAYKKGHEDTLFDPVEYVKDDESILKYGERWGALDDNDDIFPTIQGITLSGLGRVDEVVAVSEIVTDDVMDLADKSAVIESLHGVMSQVDTIPALQSVSKQIRGETFEVPTGLTANVQNNGFFAKAPTPNEAYVNVDEDFSRIRIYNASTGTEVVSGSAGLPAGTYYYVIDITVVNTASSAIANVTYGVNGLDLVRSDASAESWKPTFDIWVKNLWQTTQGVNESDEDYALRVWGPILGDRLGNEAKIVFSDGFMAVSDYEFVIASYPVPDRSRVIGSYNSEWKITLYKSDAEYEVSGLYIPNNTSGGKPIAGDHFFFIGIDMPYLYVTLAEERLNTFKTTALGQMKDVNPTWVIHLDKIRINELRGQQEQSLFDRISAGCEMHVRDKRFTGNEILRLFANSITYTWQEPTNDNPCILPDVEIVVSDHIVVEKSTVEKMQGDLDVLKATYAKMSDMEAVIQQVASPMFLRKTGEQDTSLSPTKFASVVTSRDFRQGGFGGRGWGLYRDNSSVYQPEAQAAAAGTRSTRRRAATRSGSNENDSEEQATDAVLEIDKLVVRKEMHVNNLVVNQITYVGGKQIVSAANIECVQVVETDTGYICYFDQKQGSVKNLFQVNDIAMGQVFSPENVELRYYKMVVTAIDIDSITLAKAGRDGSGAPQKGDVIVQYGNTTDTDRQYVIIRDVIGGGYERMLSGLNATTATGEEYYFAGFDGSESSTPGVPVGPRFFVGGQNSNMQFKESTGTLAIKGVIAQSQSGDESVVTCFRGAYASNKTYYYGDEVYTTDGSTYVYINKNTPSTNRTPTDDGVYWKLKTSPAASAKLISIKASSLVFSYESESSSSPSGDQSITLTAVTQNIPQSATYVWQYYNGSTWVNISGATSTTLTVLPGDDWASRWNNNELRIKVIVTYGNNDTLYDEQALYKVYGGTDSISAFLSNTTHLFAGNSDTAVQGSDTFETIVFRGKDRLSFGSNLATGDYTIGTITGQITGQITAAVDTNPNSANYGKITVSVTSSLSQRSGTLTIPIKIKGYGSSTEIISGTTYTYGTVELVYSWALSLTGQKGDVGAKLRGPTRWEDTSSYESGRTSEFQDIVIDGDMYYLCVVDVTGSSASPALAPGSDIYDGSTGHWKPSNKMDFVATQVFFSEKGKIDNLVIDHLYTEKTVTENQEEKIINPICIEGETITIMDADPQSSTYGEDMVVLTSGKLQSSSQGGTVSLTNRSKSASIAIGEYADDFSGDLDPFCTISINGINNSVTLPKINLSMGNLPSGTDIVCYYQLYIGNRFLASGRLYPGSSNVSIGGGTFTLPVGNHSYYLNLSGTFYATEDVLSAKSITISANRDSVSASVAYSSDFRAIATDGTHLTYGYEGIRITPIVNNEGGAKVIQGGQQYNMLGAGTLNPTGADAIPAPRRIMVCDDYPSTMADDVLYIKVQQSS